jgi:hypothetical protein
MSLFNAFIKSLKLNNLKIALYIWVFNLAITGIAIFTLWNLFSFSTGRSVFQFADESLNFLTFFINIYLTNKSSFLLAISIIMLVLFFFIILSIFVSGGVYSVLINNEMKTFKNLISSSIENFSRFLMIFLSNLVTWFVLFFISAIGLYFMKAILSHTGNEILFRIILYLWISIVIILTLIAMAVYDFSRIIFIKTEKNFFYCHKKGFLYVITHKGIIFPFFITYTIIFIILQVMFTTIQSQVENSIPVFLLLLIHQAFIISKYFMKAILMNTEANLLVTEPEP